MKPTKRFFYAALAGSLLLGSCAEDGEENYDIYELQSLHAWVAQHRPDLKENFQPVGESGYYVDVLDEGNDDASPIGDDDMWVSFDFSARDLNGNVVLTRNASEAKLLNTFTRYTRYVPYYRYCGSENSGMLEGAWLAMRNPLSLDGGARTVRLREGSRVRLYLPSLLIGTGGVTGSGGYEGEKSLSASRPMIAEMTIRDTVNNPLQQEGDQIDLFCSLNGGVDVYDKEENPAPTDPLNDPNHPYRTTSKRWVSACDTVAQLYVNHRYDPTKEECFTYSEPYDVGYAPYNDPQLDKKIAKILADRFHSEKSYAGPADLHADSVGLEGTAKIWYIGRFLDGFIFDTNIDEVKELIYGSDYTAGEALSYTPSEGGLIQAFYYVIPHIQYGQWASLLTISTQAYGSAGVTGSTSTSTTGGSSMASYYDYLNYLNYVNSYYNGYYGGYYGSYYNNYYGGYYGGYYGNYYGYDDSNTTTTTTVSTEIPSFAPLIFQFYVEPQE